MNRKKWIVAAGIFAGMVGSGLAKPPVPRPSPELSFKEPSGNQASLAPYAGKVVLLQILYTTCQHCQATSRNFAKLQNDYGSRGLQVVGIAFNDEAESSADVIRAYGAMNGVNFPLGVATRDAVLNYLGLSAVERLTVPQIVIIDRGGVIRAQSDPLGSLELMDETRLRPVLEGLLAEHPTTSSKHAKHAPVASR